MQSQDYALHLTIVHRVVIIETNVLTIKQNHRYGCHTNMFFCVRNWSHIVAHLVLLLVLVRATLFNEAQVSVVSNRFGVKFGRIVPQVNMHWLIDLDLWYVILSRCRPGRHFMKKSKALLFQIGSGWKLARLVLSQVNMHQLTALDSWFDVTLSRWRPWRHLTQKSAANWWLESQHEVSVLCPASMTQHSPVPGL